MGPNGQEGSHISLYGLVLLVIITKIEQPSHSELIANVLPECKSVLHRAGELSVLGLFGRCVFGLQYTIM